jgi:hypothetical protein
VPGSATCASEALISWCGEDQVAAAPLDVDRIAQVLARDRAALDVPARPAAAEGRVPGRFAGPLGLPEQAVERVLLAWPVWVAAALAEDREHLRPVPPGDLAERRVGGDGEVQVAVDVVRRAGPLQPLHHRDHERDRLDRAYVGVGRDHAQRLHVGAEELGLPFRECNPVLAGRLGPLEQRVVDVGHVLHVADLVAGRAPGPTEQVEGDVRRGVAQVRGVVRRDPADVHARRAVGAARDDRTHGGVMDPHRRSHNGQPGHVG